MSLFVDLKYLKLISNQLPLFKQKSNTLYNCRCIICGDSTTKKNKARGYFYAAKNDLFYKCHNCNASMHFGTFLKQLNGLQYSQYVLERYNEGLPSNRPHQKIEDRFKMAEPVFVKKEKRLIDELMDRLDKLPNDNEAVQFCLKRKIPLEKYHRLYYIDNIKNIVQLNQKYKDNIQTEEPRLVLPFFDKTGDLIAVTCRALRDEKLRYVTIKIREEEILAYGLDEVDTKNDIYVVEGPIDSLFINNAVAVAGTAFTKLDTLGLPKDKVVAILDNQPRNKDVCKILNKMIENGYRVVIWPQTLEQKDINEMVLAGKDHMGIIKKHIYQGLEAKIKFIEWKRC